MILRMAAAAIAIAVGFAGGATAQVWQTPGVGSPSRALLIDHKDKHKDAKNKHRVREDEDENDAHNEDRNRSRRSSNAGRQRGYTPNPSDYAPSPYDYAPSRSYDQNARAPRRWTNPEPSR